MRLVRSLREEDARNVAAAVRERGPFRDVESLWRVGGVRVAALRALAQADAFGSMGLDRQGALWQVRRLRDEVLPLFDEQKVQRCPEKVQRCKGAEVQRGDGRPCPPGAGGSSPFAPLHLCTSAPSPSPSFLPSLPPSTTVLHDYKATGLSLKAHPVSFVRGRLEEMKAVPAAWLRDPARTPAGRHASVAGVVLVRQRPGTASGIVFITLEDETGIANLIVRASVFERYRRVARTSSVLLARGRVERQGEVVHLLVTRLHSLSELVGLDRARSRDFH